ncbi:hypothetical protein SBDP1_1190020 [Syntrophobacter sp. SbD1]|nr:hypothetical protein SBDP1_1190020 [Syntrophobacter sp. SbD1]
MFLLCSTPDGVSAKKFAMADVLQMTIQGTRLSVVCISTNLPFLEIYS